MTTSAASTTYTTTTNETTKTMTTTSTTATSRKTSGITTTTPMSAIAPGKETDTLSSYMVLPYLSSSNYDPVFSSAELELVDRMFHPQKIQQFIEEVKMNKTFIRNDQQQKCHEKSFYDQ